MTTAAAPPGPRGLPFLGVAPALARDPYRSLERIAREYGDVASVPLPFMDLILISHPDHVKHVMTKNYANYGKPRLTRDTIFREPPRFHGMADGEEWRTVRKALNPKFTERGLAPLSELMIDSLLERVDAWGVHVGTAETVDMQRQFNLLTMSVMLRSMFTRPAPMEDVERLADNFAALLRGMGVWMLTSSLPNRMPRPYGRATAAALQSILGYCEEMMRDRRTQRATPAGTGTQQATPAGTGSNPIPEGDLLSMLMTAELEDGSRMDDEHIRRELVGLIIGGYETTAAVMSWVLARLPSNPDAQARAYAEVDALGGRRVAHEDMERLTWLRACFDEAQRMQGFPINPREAIEDDEIGGYRIAAGTTVGVSGWAMHRDPRYWREPERFDPSRFLEDDIETYAFLPFGMGPRRCLGVRMGYMVGLYTLCSAFQRYRFTPPAGWKPEPHFSFASIVKGGVPMTIELRGEA